MNQAQKNFTLGVVREGFWGMGFGFITPATILTLALVDMGRSAVSASLLNTLLFTGVLAPPLLSALLLPSKFTHPRPLALLHLPILLGVLCAGIGLLVVPHEITWARLFLLFAGIGVYGLGSGLVEPHWIASMGRAIPHPVRGRFFGTILCTSSLCGTFSGWLAAHWVSQDGAKGAYALCFFSAFTCLSISVFLLAFMKPLGPAPHPPPPNALKSAFKLLRQKMGQPGSFRNGILLTFLIFLAALPAAIVTVYLREQVKLDASWFEIYTPALTLGGMVGALSLGFLLDHRGLKAAFTTAFLAGLSVPILAFAGDKPMASLLAFVCAGFFANAFPSIAPVLILRLSHHKESSIQAGLFYSLMAPWSLSTLGYGLLAAHFGYGTAFGAAIVFCSVALLFLVRIGRLDPKPKK